MRLHTIDHRRDRDLDTGPRVDLSFWIDLPRLIPLCRLLGHRPVVDGVEYRYASDGRDRRKRWVCCDRCGIRPHPQGSLNPEACNVGDRYEGPWDRRVDIDDRSLPQAPGTWPENPGGVLGGQIVVGPTFPGASIEVKVGNPGSEHTLAGHVRLGRSGALYLHTEGHGKWLQRRLVPKGYESRVVSVGAHGGRLYWRFWVPRDSHDRRRFSRWRDGSTSTNWRDYVLGKTVCTHEKIGEPVEVTVRLPDGDEHLVALQLERWRWSRPRAQRADLVRWDVDWTADGIPTKRGGHGRVYGSGVNIQPALACAGEWVGVATAKVQTQIAEMRAREGYRPEVTV